MATLPPPATTGITLDLRPGGYLGAELGRRLTDIAGAIQADFDAFLSETVRANGVTGALSLSRALIRNTQVNSLYERFCRLRLLQLLLQEKGAVGGVITDGEATTEIVRVLAGAVPIIIVKQSGHHSMPSRLLRSVARLLVRALCAWRTRRRASLPTSPLTLIDTFVLPGSFRDGRYQDRYWGALWEAMTPAEQDHARYLPTLVGHRSFDSHLQAFRDLRGDGRFLLREDWLALSDYIGVLVTSLRLPRQIVRAPHFLGLDVSRLVREESARDLASWEMVDALLMQRAVRRLKAGGAQLRLALDWFEGQQIDRALTMSVHENFPGTPVVAYCGTIVADEELYPRIAPHERQAGITADSVAVVGEGYVARARERDPAIVVEVAPAARYHHVWKQRRRNPDPAYLTLLAALPIDGNRSREMIAMLEAVVPVRTSRPLRVWLKRHPVQSADAFADLPEGATHLSFVDGDLGSLLEQSDVLVSSASASCLEAAVYGIPVLVTVNPAGPTYNTIPSALRDKSRLCGSAREIREALVQGVGARSPQDDESDLVARYFAPTDRTGLRRLLRLEPF